MVWYIREKREEETGKTRWLAASGRGQGERKRHFCVAVADDETRSTRATHPLHPPASCQDVGKAYPTGSCTDAVTRCDSFHKETAESGVSCAGYPETRGRSDAGRENGSCLASPSAQQSGSSPQQLNNNRF